jgi:hypothetical protein
MAQDSRAKVMAMRMRYFAIWLFCLGVICAGIIPMLVVHADPVIVLPAGLIVGIAMAISTYIAWRFGRRDLEAAGYRW